MQPGRGADTKERVLDAAEELLRRLGPAKTNVIDVARHLGMSHANVYRHFNSKSELQDAVAERWLGRLMPPLAAIAEASGPAAPRLRGWLATLADAKRRKVLDEPLLFATYHALAQASRRVVDAHLLTLRDQVATILQDGMAGGEFRAADPKATAEAILSATVRFHHPQHLIEDHRNGALPRLDPVLDLLLHGLRDEHAPVVPGARRP